jgi:glyoxylase-like metal-dependent hydrolase (beta-lactamase superfamily II)
VAADRVDLVKSDHALDDLVRLVPTPGHSIDHFSVQVGKAGADALIAGDLIHSPLQMRYPDLGMWADHDSAQAGRSRRRMLDRLCDTSTLLCTCHFPSPSMGRVARWDDGFRFLPV